MAKKEEMEKPIKVIPEAKTKVFFNTKMYRVELPINSTISLAFAPREEKTVPINTPLMEGMGIIQL